MVWTHGPSLRALACGSVVVLVWKQASTLVGAHLNSARSNAKPSTIRGVTYKAALARPQSPLIPYSAKEYELKIQLVQVSENTFLKRQ
jgi:hypothetical protein